MLHERFKLGLLKKGMRLNQGFRFRLDAARNVRLFDMFFSFHLLTKERLHPYFTMHEIENKKR